MFKKFKKHFKRFMTGKSGFSLVELIVVIAIMAVMAAVLAPALLGYVERSRAQKDDSAFDEVVNSVQLSLADQDVYDEMLMYSAEQYSCYVDSDSPDDANKVDIKTGKYFMYNDNERQLDETVYRLDGVMRGVTITFAPDAASSNKATFDLIKGHVNKYLPSGKKTYGGLTGANASPQLSAIVDSELYNSLRATIGDKIAISSQTYRNSEYTIFISMGTTGGNQADMQDAIKVWGQWSGTNLPEGTSVATNGANTGTSAGSNEFQDVVSPSPVPTIDMSTVDPVLENNDWDTIQKVIQANKIEEAGWHVGNKGPAISVLGSTYQPILIGINHNGQNTASFILNFRGGWYEGGRMNNTETNEGGWRDSDMRAWLNGTVYNSMDITQHIKSTDVKTIILDNGQTTLVTTNDKMFLPSVSEVSQLEKINNITGYQTYQQEGNAFDFFANEYKDGWYQGATLGTMGWYRTSMVFEDDNFQWVEGCNITNSFYWDGDGFPATNKANEYMSITPIFVIG